MKLKSGNFHKRGTPQVKISILFNFISTNQNFFPLAVVAIQRPMALCSIYNDLL